MVFAAILALVVISCATFVLFFKHSHSYWSKRNVPTPATSVPFGNLQGFGKRVHSSQSMKRLYTEMRNSGPFCGIYFFHKPAVLAISMDFIKRVLIKDFHAFQERGVYYNEKDDPLSAHLFSVDGARWKGLRSKLTPTFTSGKMKFMFPTIVQVAEEFRSCMTQMIAADGDVLEMKELLARFTTDVIGTCAFGIDCNSLKDPNAQFRMMGKKVFGKPRNSGMKSFFMLTFKELARSLHMKSHHDDVTEFFMRIVRETIELREKNDISRNDFMDLLIKIKNEGSLDGASVGTITMEEIAAQAFVFFLAGFETSSTTLSYVLYELALNPEIQTKGRAEIDSVMAKHGGQLTYEAMMEMHYIDNIINESLRKYPPGANLIRMATSDYTDPDSKATIEKDTIVMIPVYGIHHDAAFYPEPERFDPDRFTPEVVASRPHLAFLPFGDGPRNCIGLRFGMMQARIGLITMLRHFEFDICEQTIVPLEFAVTNVVLTAKGGLFLKFKSVGPTVTQKLGM